MRLAAGANEGSYGEVNEHCTDGGKGKKLIVLRSVDVLHSASPRLLAKEESENPEEYTDYFKPEGSASVGERPPDGFTEFPRATRDGSALLLEGGSMPRS